MRIEMLDPVATADRHGPGLAVRGAFLLFVWFAGWSVTASVPEPILGSATCRELPGATTQEYLTGVACPPEGFEGRFGYNPVRSDGRGAGGTPSPRGPTAGAAARSGASAEPSSSRRPAGRTTTATTWCGSGS